MTGSPPLAPLLFYNSLFETVNTLDLCIAIENSLLFFLLSFSPAFSLRVVGGNDFRFVRSCCHSSQSVNAHTFPLAETQILPTKILIIKQSCSWSRNQQVKIFFFLTRRSSDLMFENFRVAVLRTLSGVVAFFIN